MFAGLLEPLHLAGLLLSSLTCSLTCAYVRLLCNAACRVAVGVVVLRKGPTTGQTEVLLINRGTPPATEGLCIPGGRLELGESLAAGAVREVKEETGIVRLQFLSLQCLVHHCTNCCFVTLELTQQFCRSPAPNPSVTSVKTKTKVVTSHPWAACRTSASVMHLGPWDFTQSPKLGISHLHAQSQPLMDYTMERTKI